MQIIAAAMAQPSLLRLGWVGDFRLLSSLTRAAASVA